ncbi:MAG: LuxR C-terminal-related transcriptional regulator [Gammaproteobacteria bacterium]|nr:LuxR C-terminal-related transcriptional regulator [Gammaproteobacteria bacterium]
MADKYSSENAALPLVSTRLMPPQLPGDSIARKRLLQHLNDDSRRAGILAVVTAPAGYGKSTLLAQSNQAYKDAGWITAWLNLEESDNDEDVFLHDLLGVLNQLLRQTDPKSVSDYGKGWKLLSGINLVADIINSVSHIAHHHVMFLDDYHVIHDKQIHLIIQNLITHLPDNLNLIVGSRTQLPIPMAKLRANNRLVSIEMDDLRFNQKEANLFFQKTHKLDIDSIKLEQLYQRTGGWPAVLQLAAISLREAADELEFINNFSGSTGPVSEYLLEEIMDLLPENFASFLVRSSITERLCYPLCKAITENDEFSRELDDIGRDRFLIQRLDDEGYWYRFHPIFRNFLLKQMELRFQDETHILHQRASSWYEEHGMIAEATQHAISGGDENHALALLEEQGMHFVNHGYLPLLLSLIRRLPSNFLHGSLEILIQLAWVEVLNNHVHTARDLVNEIKLLLKRQEVRSEEEWMNVHALEVPICFFEDDYIEGKKLVNNWRHKAPKTSILNASLSVISSYIHLNEYRYDKALEVTHWLMKPDDQLEFAYSHSFAACAHGLVYLYRGMPNHGIDCLDDAMKWLNLHVSSNSQTMTVIKPILAVCYYQLGELQQAARLMEEGLSILNSLAAPDHVIGHVPVRTRLLYANEGSRRALDYLLDTKILAEERNWYRLEACVLHESIRLYIDLGSVDQARVIFEQGVKKLVPDISGTTHRASQSREWMKIAEARILLAEGNAREAVSIIARLLSKFKADRRTFRVMELLVLLARCYVESGHIDRAGETLTDALILDEEHSIQQLFRDEGQSVLQALANLVQSDEDSSFPDIVSEQLTKILRPVKITGTPDDNLIIHTENTRNNKYQLIVESLTKRELATMKKVAEGYSNKEISDALYISINTVKSHIYSSFNKLGVTRRTQAVRRLKELGILR